MKTSKYVLRYDFGAAVVDLPRVTLVHMVAEEEQVGSFASKTEWWLTVWYEDEEEADLTLGYKNEERLRAACLELSEALRIFHSKEPSSDA